MNISDAAVEAAVKAWDHYWGDRYGDEALEEMSEEVRVALTAAKPFLVAEMVKDVLDGLRECAPGDTYAISFVDGYLDAAQDEIERAKTTHNDKDAA